MRSCEVAIICPDPLFQGGGTAAAVPGCHHAVGHSQDQTETQAEGASAAWEERRGSGYQTRFRVPYFAHLCWEIFLNPGFWFIFLKYNVLSTGTLKTLQLSFQMEH